jgi:hypothetical protein
MSGTSNTRNKSRGRTRNDYKRLRLPKSELNLDWAKANVQLTDRKIEILKILHQHHLMTIEQLEYFHSSFGHQSESLHLLRRDINKLHEVYFLDKALKKPVVQWDGSIKKTMVIALGEAGSQYVGWPEYYKRIRIENSTAYLPKTAHHTIRVHDMEIQTRELLKYLDIEVKAWAYECGNRIVNHSNGLNPDAFCMMLDRTNGKYYTAFLEYDTGKDDFGRRNKFPNLTKKIDRYKEIKDWNAWNAKPISTRSENKFPHIFFVTEEPKRFPNLPKVFDSRRLENTVCMQQDYLTQLTNFIQKMRSRVSMKIAK